VGRYDSRDGGGRAAPGAAAESNAGAVAGDPQGCGKVEQRRSSCRELRPGSVADDSMDGGGRATTGSVAEGKWCGLRPQVHG